MKILAHTCFIGVTGYANHAKSFFCALNKYHTVKVRNSTIGSGWKGMNNTPHDNEPYITDEMKDMLILQTLNLFARPISVFLSVRVFLSIDFYKSLTWLHFAKACYFYPLKVQARPSRHFHCSYLQFLFLSSVF